MVHGRAGKKNIFISQGKIERLADAEEAIAGHSSLVTNMQGLVAFPGFINSHDHLDFNNYPQLGNGGYNNYAEWGPGIHNRYAAEIEAVKRIPQPLRIQWGLYKNLLNGFTTVVNHGEKIKGQNSLITVFQDCYNLHSVSFEKNWWWKLNHPFRNSQPYVMHLGEGVDEKALLEIKKIKRSNILRKKIIAVHGIAMTSRDIDSFAGLVWCPASNYFMFGKTADINELKSSCTIMFGTDSTLTSPWRVQEHFRQALAPGGVTGEELADMLTVTPARTWKLSDCGIIAEGKAADIVIYSGTKLDEAVMMMVIKNGEVMLADETLIDKKETGLDRPYSRIRLGRQVLYVKGNLAALTEEIVRYYPAAEIPFNIL